MQRAGLSLLLMVLLGLPMLAAAEHSIDVQRLSAQGEHFKALTAFEKLPKRRVTTEASIAAARSAWALGLPERAIEEYEQVLRDEKLDPIERARIYLSRGIIEYQEDRFQVAQLYAEKARDLIDSNGPLRAKVWFLLGQTLERLGRYGAAEEHYQLALEESPREERGDIYFALGAVQMRLGKNEQARATLERVPLRHERTPQAIRLLSTLALEAKEFEQAEFWLHKGRNDYRENFLDSWTDYAMLRIAIEKHDESQVESVRDRAKAQYPPSDPWLVLLEASYASYRWGAVNQTVSKDH